MLKPVTAVKFQQIASTEESVLTYFWWQSLAECVVPYSKKGTQMSQISNNER